MSQLDKLKEQEAELESLFYGEKEDNPSKEDDQTTDQDEIEATSQDDETEQGLSFEESTEVITQDDDETESEEDPVKPKRKGVSWKKRFTSYKASTDATIHSLRMEVAKYKSDLADAYDARNEAIREFNAFKKSIEDAKDPYDGIITAEDRELLGEEELEIIKKITKANKQGDNSKVEALEAEVQNLRKQASDNMRKEKEDLSRMADERFRAGLEKAVDNFNEYDTDPNFVEWLNEIDIHSGEPRMKSFNIAVSNRDILGTAHFFNAYVAQKPKTKEEILSSKVKPVGSTGVASDTSINKGDKNVYSLKDYENFMTDVTRGKYKGREQEAKKIEARYDKAFYEGRIVK